MKTEIKVKRAQLADERFKMLVSKIIQTQTTQNEAYHINKFFKEVTRLSQEYADKFNIFKDQFAKKTEDGKYELGRDDENREVPDSWMPREEAKADLDKAIKDLHEEEVLFKFRPLTPATLKDVKISAYELELLGDLYTAENGPGVPHGLHAI